MRVFWIIALLVGVSVVATLSIFFPSILASNGFLRSFITYEIMPFLIVILTITFASVAQIHLSVSTTQTSIKDAETRKKIEDNFAKPLRAETQSSAWLLFWALVICTISLLVKGEYPKVEAVQSATNGIGLLVLITNAVVLYDIYSTIFALVGIEASRDKD